MRRVVIESLVGFIKQTDNFDLLAETVIFRGQPLEGKLVPAIA